MILSKRFPFFLPFRNFSKKILSDDYRFPSKILRCLWTLKLRYFIETTSRKRDYEFQMKVSTPSKCKNRGQSTVLSTYLQLKFITLIRTLSSSIGENSFSSFSWCLFPPAWTMSAIFYLRTSSQRSLISSLLLILMIAILTKVINSINILSRKSCWHFNWFWLIR